MRSYTSRQQRREFLRRTAAVLTSISTMGCGGGSGGAVASPGDSSTVPPQLPDGKPAIVAPPIVVTPAPTSIGAMQFSLISPQANALAPFSIGFSFRAGDVALGQSVVSADVPRMQVVAKNRWPDGSLKFAVISGLAPLIANEVLLVRLSPAAETTGGTTLTLVHLQATGITAEVSAGVFGSASWANAEWADPFIKWISGPVMSSWLFRKPIGVDAHLVAWFEVRLYAGGAVEVLPWIENGYLLVSGPTSKAATFGFTLGGTQRFSEVIDLPNHCRTPLISGTRTEHWLGIDPQVTPKHDTDYLQSTALVPSYRAKVATDAARVLGLTRSYTPLQQGNMPTSMGAGGYHGSIGILPEWDVLYLTSTSSMAYTGLIFNAYSAGRYGIHFRDEKTNRPLRFSSYPNLVVGGGSKINDNGASTTNSYTPNATGTPPATWAFTHHPSIGFMAYLVTGRWYFMEELQFAATLHYLKTTDWRRNFSQGVMSTQANTTRGIAWIIRTLAQAACITPDDDLPLRNEFAASLQSNIDWNHTLYVAQPNNPFGWAEPYSDYSGAGNNVYFEATWQQDFYTAVFGYVKAMLPPVSASSLARLDEFFAWKARSIVGRLGGTGPNEYPYYEAAPYTIAVAPTDSPDFVKGTGPWFADWGAVYKARTETPNPPGSGDQLRGGFFPDATSYWGNLQPAIAYAVQHRVPGALEAYGRLTSASNWPKLANNFNINPVWSVRPSNLP